MLKPIETIENRLLLSATSSSLDVAVQELPQGVDVAGTFYFAGPSTATDTLWRSDGTKAGTRPVSDGTTGLRVFSPSQFVNANGTLYFTGNDSGGPLGIHSQESLGASCR
jgi:ELWxxDGT repeat protein